MLGYAVWTGLHNYRIYSTVRGLGEGGTYSIFSILEFRLATLVSFYIR